MLKKLAIGLSLGTMVFVSSGIGILSQPKPAEASWTAIAEVIQRIALAVYKGIVLPLVRQMFLSWAAGQSDFPLFPLALGEFIDYVLGTALDSFFYELSGIHICGGIQINIKLAIALIFFYGKFRLNFGFKGCKLTEIINNSSFDFSWEAQVGLFERGGTDVGAFFLASDEARAALGTSKDNVLADFFAAGGVLSMQDCSTDVNGNGRTGDKPGDCRVTTPGGIVEDLISENVIGPDTAAQQSMFVQDAIAIGIESVAVYLNTLMFKGLAELAGSKSSGGALQYDFDIEPL